MVRAGYKQTEVGEIPEDWDIFSLGECVTKFQLGGNYSNTLEETEAPLIKMGNLGRGAIKLEKIEYISSSVKVNSKDLLVDGDVLFNTRNTLELVGKVAIWRNELHKAYFNSNIMRMTFDEKIISSNYFMNYSLNSKKSIDVLAGIATGTTSVAAIYARDLVSIKLCIAPLGEQKSIAKALSDVDDLIISLEKLIAKKHDIKTATMQQLLTGKKRVPGFGKGKGYKLTELGEIPEDWDVKKVKEFSDCTAGGTPSTLASSYWGGNIPWMSSGELHLKRVNNVEARITESGLKNSSTKLIPRFCVLVGLAGQGKTRGTVAINNVELCTNQSIAAIFPSENHVTDYLFYNLENRYEELRSLSTGDGGRGGLNLTIIRNMEIPFPSKAEQFAIAEIIFNIDRNIELLNIRLAKTKAIKQGMMQQLLTGRTRLIEPLSTNAKTQRKRGA